MNEYNIRWLRLLAPYFAVGIFWVGFSNAWLAIIAYHVQIVLWHRFGRRMYARKQEGQQECYHARTATSRGLIAQYAMVVCVMAGPLVYFLLPRIALVDLAQWLDHHRMSGLAFYLMIPYFGIVHPIVEQLHWHRLRTETAWAHIAFAGYHVVVLSSLLPIIWLVLCFLALIAISWLWRRTGCSVHSRWLCTYSHMAADTGLVLAVFWLVYR